PRLWETRPMPRVHSGLPHFITPPRTLFLPQGQEVVRPQLCTKHRKRAGASVVVPANSVRMPSILDGRSTLHICTVLILRPSPGRHRAAVQNTPIESTFFSPIDIQSVSFLG